MAEIRKKIHPIKMVLKELERIIWKLEGWQNDHAPVVKNLNSEINQAKGILIDLEKKLYDELGEGE